MDASSSNNGSDGNDHTSNHHGEEEYASTSTPIEERLDHVDYVEARALLRPAIDFLEHGIVCAQAQNLLWGDLFSTVCPILYHIRTD